MNRRLVSMILIAVVAVAAVAGIGIYEYRAGVAQGLAMSNRVPTGPGAVAYPYPYWHGYVHPFGFVFPLLFVILIFAFARRLFWWGRWRGPEGPGYWRGGTDGRLDEWHRKAHESMATEQPR
jgi:hypothetical protein